MKLETGNDIDEVLTVMQLVTTKNSSIRLTQEEAEHLVTVIKLRIYQHSYLDSLNVATGRTLFNCIDKIANRRKRLWQNGKKEGAYSLSLIDWLVLHAELTDDYNHLTVRSAIGKIDKMVKNFNHIIKLNR